MAAFFNTMCCQISYFVVRPFITWCQYNVRTEHYVSLSSLFYSPTSRQSFYSHISSVVSVLIVGFVDSCETELRGFFLTRGRSGFNLHTKHFVFDGLLITSFVSWNKAEESRGRCEDVRSAVLLWLYCGARPRRKSGIPFLRKLTKERRLGMWPKTWD